MNNYEITKQRILELADGEEEGEDDYGFYKPTSYALETILELLDTLHQRLGDAFPRGFGSTEYRGGVDIMKTKNLTILIQVDDDLVYQVALEKQHECCVLDLVAQLHGGSVKLFEKPVESVMLI